MFFFTLTGDDPGVEIACQGLQQPRRHGCWLQDDDWGVDYEVREGGGGGEGVCVLVVVVVGYCYYWLMEGGATSGAGAAHQPKKFWNRCQVPIDPGLTDAFRRVDAWFLLGADRRVCVQMKLKKKERRRRRAVTFSKSSIINTHTHTKPPPKKQSNETDSPIRLPAMAMEPPETYLMGSQSIDCSME
jgi:hypothetical protein